MSKIKIDPRKLLGFRLLPHLVNVEPSPKGHNHALLAAKIGGKIGGKIGVIKPTTA